MSSLNISVEMQSRPSAIAYIPCYEYVRVVLSLRRLVAGFGHQYKAGTLEACKNSPTRIIHNSLYTHQNRTTNE